LDGVVRTVVWDVDDVLNDLMQSWFDSVWTPEHPGELLRYAGVSQNPPHKLLGVGRDEYLASLKEIGAAYREVMGRVYPAMAVVAVAGLIEASAKVEIEATAVVPG